MEGADAGVRHVDVDAAEILHRHLDKARGSRRVGDIALDEDAIAALGSDCGKRVLGWRIAAKAGIGALIMVDDDTRTLARERDRCRPADTARAASNDRNFTLEQHRPCLGCQRREAGRGAEVGIADVELLAGEAVACT